RPHHGVLGPERPAGDRGGPGGQRPAVLHAGHGGADRDPRDTLSSEGPVTVFAPTDAAFQAALDALGITAEELLAREDLADILTYHVVPSQVLAADVLQAVEDGGGEFMVTAVNGAQIAVTVVDGVVTLNSVARVTAADLMAGNGV